MLVERLQRQWRESAQFRPTRSSMSLEAEGLVLGNGTMLAKTDRDRFGMRRLLVDGAEARLLALLSIAYGRPMPLSVLDHIRKASRALGQGEDCQAALHLAFARLPKLDDRREAARLLFLAEGMISSGVAPRDVLATFGLGAVQKYYDERETRVPAGEGRASGEWSTDGAGPGSFLERLPKAVLAPLARFAARFAGPATALGMMFFPSRAGGRAIEGRIAGDLDLSYAWNEDETRLRIIDGAGKIVLTADLGADGLFRDDRQTVIGRALDEHVILDTDALRTELPKNGVEDEDPKLCPVPGKDKKGRTSAAGEKDRDYEDYVKRLINPDNPTPRGFGVQLPNPLADGRSVYYDDCQRRSGILIEAKGTGYAEPLAREDPFMRDIFSASWIAQARRQVAASGGRPIEWHFAERGAAEYARTLFAKTKGLEDIQVIYTPWSEASE